MSSAKWRLFGLGLNELKYSNHKTLWTVTDIKEDLSQRYNNFKNLRILFLKVSNSDEPETSAWFSVSSFSIIKESVWDNEQWLLLLLYFNRD